MNKLAIFASGEGTNAKRIAEYFKNRSEIKVDCVLSNNPKAPVIERFNGTEIEMFVFTRDEFYNSEKVIEYLKERGVSFIILAGFLWLVPDNIIRAYENRIINVHPSLLPMYGGKGMFGSHVHRAVVEAGEKETGITIHYVNGKYDEGNHIFQATCPIEAGDTPEDVARKVHQLEYRYFPEIIEKVLKSV